MSKVKVTLFDAKYRVTTLKLLGINVSDDLRWDAHIDMICSKVNSKIYYLKQLKRAGLSTDDLLCFYTTVIRPSLEYVCFVWHHGLTRAQSDKLESFQKRAIRIIFGDSGILTGAPYFVALAWSEIQSLHSRRIQVSKDFFTKICHPCLAASIICCLT